MGWRDRLRLAYRALSSDSLGDAREAWVGPPAASGVIVNQQTALTVAAYWNGIQIISGSMGVIDRCLYKRVGEDDREKATGHPVYKLLHDTPNPYMSAQVFWQTVISHRVGWGNGYAEIEWDQAMRPIALWPILPHEIEPVAEAVRSASGGRSTKLWYRYLGQHRIEAEDILDFVGLGFDGIRGYSPVAMARQSLGLSIAAERFGATFFGKGAWPGLAVEHPKNLTKQAADNIKASIRGDLGGENSNSIFILEEGMKISKPITIPPDDAQFLQTREFQIEEVARWLNLPPHKLKHKGGERPGGNIEVEQIAFLTDTLLPIATGVEQECTRKLIPKAQRGSYYVEHNFQKILRTDAKTRMEVQKGYYEMTVLDPEQIARQENLPKPKPAPVAELAPAAAPPAPVDPPQPEPAADADDGQARARRASAQRALLLDVAGRWVRRESAAARRASKKGPPAFQAWAEEFYTREVDVLREFLEPAVAFVLAVGGSDGDARGAAQALAEGYVARSRGELLALPARDLEGALVRLMERWETTRTAEVAEQIAALGAAGENENAA